MNATTFPNARTFHTRLRVATLFATSDRISPTFARTALALLMFPHGAQHLTGWFGGYGFAGTFAWMVGDVGIPAPLAALAIITEFFAPIALLIGAGSRLAAVGLIGVMLGAIPLHVEHGFFMNWFAQAPAGAEGFEYHLLVIALALTVVIDGSGALSVDRKIMRRVQSGGAA